MKFLRLMVTFEHISEAFLAFSPLPGISEVNSGVGTVAAVAALAATLFRP